MVEEAYMWLVEYDDQGWHGEYDPHAPEGRGWAEIETQRVKTIALSNWECTQILHQVAIPEGAQPLFFRRRQISLSDEGKEQGRATVHCIGWKRGGSDVYPVDAIYLFVFENGVTLLANDLQAV